MLWGAQAGRTIGSKVGDLLPDKPRCLSGDGEEILV